MCVLGRLLTMFYIGKVSELAENIDIGVYSDTINMIFGIVCMMVLLIGLYLFIPLSVTLAIFQGHNNVEQ